jgi:hypothetical protein
MGDEQRSRPDDALIEPLFAGLLHQDRQPGAEPSKGRGRTARSIWVVCLLTLVAGLIAAALLR